MRLFTLLTMMSCGFLCAAVDEFNIGAQWNIEYRVQKKGGDMQVIFLNRRGSDVLLNFVVEPGFGNSDPAKSGSIIIGSRLSSVFPLGLSKGTMQEVKFIDCKDGIVASKDVYVIGADGVVEKRRESVFYEGTSDDVGVLVGTNVYDLVRKLELGHNDQWVTNNIESTGYWKSGTFDNDLVYVTTRVIKVPSRLTKGGKPIWNLVIELNGDIISKIQKIYEYSKK